MNKDVQNIIHEKVNWLEHYKTIYKQPLDDINKEIDSLDMEITKFKLQLQVIEELMVKLEKLDSPLKSELESDREDIRIKLQSKENKLIEQRAMFAIKQRENLETLNVIEDYIKELKNIYGHNKPVW